MRTQLVLVSLLVLFGASDAFAGRGPSSSAKVQRSSAPASRQRTTSPATRAKHQSHAKLRARLANGRFARMSAADKAIQGSVRFTGFANPASTGSSKAEIQFVAPSGKRAGSLTVAIPEHYVGATGMEARSRTVTLFATDVRGRQQPITGTLKVSAGRSSFRNARFEATVPAGIVLSRSDLGNALSRSELHVNRHSLSESPATTR